MYNKCIYLLNLAIKFSFVNLEIKINFFAVCRRAADLVFVLDMSSSIEASRVGNWKLMLQLVLDIIDRLKISEQAVHVAVVSFSDTSRYEFLLDKYYDKVSLETAIRNLRYSGGNTNTAAGLMEMKENVFDPTFSGLRGDRVNVSNVAIVITDGGSNTQKWKTIPTADEIRRDTGIPILVVGISSSVNLTEIEGISDNGVRGESYWLSTDFRVSEAIVERIVNRTCEVFKG